MRRHVILAFGLRRDTDSEMCTVREPLDKVNKEHKDLDPFEVIMYTMGLSFAIEGAVPRFMS